MRILIRALGGPIDPEQKRSWYVSTSAVEQALRAATPAPVQVIANQLDYPGDLSLRHRFPELCRQITARRRTKLQVSRTRTRSMQVPRRVLLTLRERVERALVEALDKDDLSNLRTVAASVELTSTRRFYKDFRDLRLAIVAKNRGIRK